MNQEPKLSHEQVVPVKRAIALTRAAEMITGLVVERIGGAGTSLTGPMGDKLTVKQGMVLIRISGYTDNPQAGDLYGTSKLYELADQLQSQSA